MRLTYRTADGFDHEIKVDFEELTVMRDSNRFIVLKLYECNPGYLVDYDARSVKKMKK